MCHFSACQHLNTELPASEAHLLFLNLLLLFGIPFLFCQSISQSVSQSLSFTSVPLVHTHIDITQVPSGKLLHLPMSSAMLLLSLDPKGNLMNNEQSSGRGGWGRRMRRWAPWDCKREALQDKDVMGKRREGNLLVFTHQLGQRGDKKRMEGDASWMRGGGGGQILESINLIVCSLRRQIRYQGWGCEQRDGIQEEVDMERQGSWRCQRLLSTLPPASCIIQASFVLPTQLCPWSTSRAGIQLLKPFKVDVLGI